MIPTWWEFTLLALGALRLTRLLGWDDFPPVARLRAHLLGEAWPEVDDWLAGVGEPEPTYRRPLLAQLVHCPFCLGAWVSLIVYGAWLGGGDTTLLVMTPFALSSVVGLVALNLDP